MSATWASQSPWVPVTAPLTSGTALRSPDLLVQVIAQFEVETTPRYAPRNGKTYCNIFVWDVTRALGCEVPHWWLSTELTANALAGWLAKVGPIHGWEMAHKKVACAYAKEGKPAIAIWKNPGAGPGHIAVLVPSRFESETEIAQAGKTNFSRGSLTRGFGARSVTFYVHP